MWSAGNLWFLESWSVICKTIYEKDGGYFIIIVLVLGALGIAGITGLVSFANSNLLAHDRSLQGVQALQLAEAGIEYYRLYLNNGGDINETSIEGELLDKDGLSVGVYELSIEPSLNGFRIVSEGRAGDSVRRIEVVLIAGDGASFYYGVQSGAGGFTLGNNSQIVGNVFSNGDISGGNGSSITGDALAVGEISNVNVGGEIQTGVSPQEFPIPLDLVDKWKDEADEETIAGNLSLSGEDNALGSVKIEGDLSLSNSTSLVVTGTIWITGDLTIGQQSEIFLSPDYGSRGGIIIVDGDVSLGNNAILSGSGVEGSNLLLISLSLNVDIGNGAGVDVIFVPNGNINIGNNADIEVVLAEHVTLSNNTILVYEQGLINSVFTSGPSGSFRISGWRELR